MKKVKFDFYKKSTFSPPSSTKNSFFDNKKSRQEKSENNIRINLEISPVTKSNKFYLSDRISKKKPLITPTNRRRISSIDFDPIENNNESQDVSQIRKISLHKDQHREYAYDILKKLPEKRDLKDIRFLTKIFSNIKFFTELSNNMDVVTNNAIFRNLNFEYVSKYKPVFFYGDIGRKFYIILEGKVAVLLPKVVEVNQRISNANIYEKLEDLKKIEESPLKHGRGHKSLEERLMYLYPENNIVSTLGVGETFGEIALERQVTRTATIVCTSDCHFATLTNDVYKKILHTYFEKKNKEKTNLLKKTALMCDLKEENIDAILLHCKELTYNLNNIVYKEGDESSNIYIIYEGSVQVYLSSIYFKS